MPAARLAPTTILVQSNLNGTVAAIQDDPDAPDAAWLTASANNQASDLRVAFPTTPGAPSGTQEVRARVRKFGGGNALTVNLEVYDGATLLASTSGTVGASSVLAVTWPGGPSTVEARIASVGQSGKASNQSTVEVGAVEWNAVYADPPAELVWSRWDGSIEVPLVVSGVWDGSVVQPASLVERLV